MKFVNAKLPTTHNIYLLGDFHEGTIFQDSKALERAITRIKKDPIGYVAIMGDLCEATTVDHPFYRPQSERKIVLPLEQYSGIKVKLLPIKEKILVILEGNHDLRMHRYGNFVEQLALSLGVPYGTYTCVLQIENLYKIFLTHGRKGINSTCPDPSQKLANMQRQLRDRLKNKMGDCVIMARAHTHRLLMSEPVDVLYLYTEQGKIESKYKKTTKPLNGYVAMNQRYYISTGGFVRNYVDGFTSYGETLDLDPLEIGMAVIHVKKNQIANIELARLA